MDGCIENYSKTIKVCPDNVFRPSSLEELKMALHSAKSGVTFVGSSHSYSGVQCVEDSTAIVFDGSGIKRVIYDYETEEITFECGATVKDVKKRLRNVGRRLETSGNHDTQRMIGAILTGTNGFDKRCGVIGESVTRMIVLDGDELRELTEEEMKWARVSFGKIGPVISMTLKTKPLSQFKVNQSLISLDTFREKLIFPLLASDAHFAFTLLPHSHPTNPTIGLTYYKELKTSRRFQKTERSGHLSRFVKSLTMGAILCLDDLFPKSRSRIQKLIKQFVEGKQTRILFTDPSDIDYLYDPSPLLAAEKDPEFLMRGLAATHNADEIGFIVGADELWKCIKTIQEMVVEYADRGTYIKNFIAFRYIGESRKCRMAGNYYKKGYAVDIYFDKKDQIDKELFQRELFEKLDTVKPHWGKTVLTDVKLDELFGDRIEDFNRFCETFSVETKVRL